jgi:drug/metabolite transporter (DMT)-like permease
MGPAFGEVPGALAWIGTAIGVVGYFSVTLADALVIEAMRTLSAAEVVADTNAYIVLATAMSLVVFRQRTRWQQRAVAAGVVCCGAGLHRGGAVAVGAGFVKADAALGPGQVSCCPWSALRQSRGATP